RTRDDRCRHACSCLGNSWITPCFALPLRSLLITIRSTSYFVLMPQCFIYSNARRWCASSSQSRTIFETRSVTLPPPGDQFGGRKLCRRWVIERSDTHVPGVGSVEAQPLTECHAVQELGMMGDEQRLRLGRGGTLAERLQPGVDLTQRHEVVRLVEAD